MSRIGVGPSGYFATAVLAIGSAACGGDGGVGTPANVTARDSSGVRIVETSNTIGAESGWSIVPAPLYRVGWAEGDPKFQSVTYGALRTDGSAIVADAGAGQLFMIPPNGEPIRAVGRGGDGPGEFNSFTGVVALGGDSVLVADGRNNRATILNGRGDVLQQIPFQPMRGFARYGIATRLDGRYALVPTMTGGNANDPPGWKEFPVYVTSDLAEFEMVVELPLAYERPRGSNNPVQLAGRVQAGPHGFVHTRSDVPQVSWYAPDGALTQVARWDAAIREVNDADWAELEAYARATIRLPPDRLEETLGRWRQDFSGILPLFGFLRVDGVGNVWLGDSGLIIRWEDRFEVVSADGVYLGSVRFPNPAWVLDISGTHALVVERDDLDVQAVALYEITKP